MCVWFLWLTRAHLKTYSVNYNVFTYILKCASVVFFVFGHISSLARGGTIDIYAKKTFNRSEIANSSCWVQNEANRCLQHFLKRFGNHRHKLRQWYIDWRFELQILIHLHCQECNEYWVDVNVLLKRWFKNYFSGNYLTEANAYRIHLKRIN